MPTGSPRRTYASGRMSRKRDQRLTSLVDHIEQVGVSSADELSRAVGVSIATLRRDLQYLETKGRIIRVIGGARRRERTKYLSSGNQVATRDGTKGNIGRVAAQYFDDRHTMTLAINGGTTTAAVAERLRPTRQMTIVTNALDIASMMKSFDELQVYVIGGRLRGASNEVVNMDLTSYYAGMNIDFACVGVGGLSAVGGITTHDEVSAITNRQMIDAAERVMVVADGTKIGKPTFTRICDLDNVDVLVTDARADHAALEAIRALGVSVLVAASCAN